MTEVTRPAGRVSGEVVGSRAVSRRAFLLRTLPRVMVLPAGAALLAACGGGPAATSAKAGTASATTTPKSTTSAAATAGSGTQPVAGGELLWGNYGTVSAINPILTADGATGLIVDFLFDPLVNFDTKYNPIPGLAKSWETSKDGKSWTFHLRKATWHDGRPFTSADVVFTVHAILSPGYTGQLTSNYNLLLGAADYLKALHGLDAKLKAKTLSSAGYDSQAQAAFAAFVAQKALEAPDPQTVTFHLTSVFAPFLAKVGFLRPLPQHLLSGQTGAKMATAAFNTHPVGTGPFSWQTGNPKSSVTLARFDGYWGQKAYLNSIVARVIPEQASAEAALQSKQIDVTTVSPQDTARFKKLSFIDLLVAPTFNYTSMMYNLARPVFKDLQVRIAICYATPKQEIVKSVLKGYGQVAWSHGSPDRWDYNPNVVKYEYDPAKAKELLAKDGWRKNSAGILEKNGLPLQFEIGVAQGQTDPDQAAVIVQQSLNQLGMKVTIRQVDWSTFVTKMLLPANYDAAIVGWGMGPDPDSYAKWVTGQPFNNNHFSDARVNRLEEEGRTTLDQAARKKIYQQIQAILAQEQPYLFLYFGDSILGVNKRLRGPIANSPRGLSWNVDRWFIPKAWQTGPAGYTG